MLNYGQHFLAGLTGKTITSDVETLILEKKVLGFTLFSRNFDNAKELFKLNQDLQNLAKSAGYRLLLAIDQEGGRVQRLKNPNFVKLPSMLELMQKNPKNYKKTFQKLARVLSEQVRSIGCQIDFAPIADVNSNPNNPIIGDRAFSHDAKIVTECCKVMVQEFTKQKIGCTLKHFPGHGDTCVDSHLELPIDERSFETIQNIDLQPYQKLIQENLVPALMTAHVVYKNWDSEFPATLSQKIISQYLRNDLYYNGVVFSDDFLMKAVFDNYDLFEASKRFLSISGDVILICDQPEITLNLIEKLESEDFSFDQKTSQERIENYKKTISFELPNEFVCQKSQHLDFFPFV